MWSPLSLVLEILTYAVMALLLWKGRTPERIVVVALFVLQFGTPLVDHLFVGQLRWGVAILSFAMFCLLTTLALIYDRWWLLLAAGAQLIAVSTHLAGPAGSDALLWSIVSTRMVVWFELMLLALFGVWEARSAPYAAFKSRRAPDRAPYKVQTR
ncbi:MAG: hypothetical protein ACK4MI_06375 [Brevundimonas sp.]|uniref:hypothetical protein n=1 Tax=Brevundimonas sp. TaxID=1871086 RepID=UPI0028D177B1|nr:hypothetical protein [uncultured Brevundimonas sp.]